LQVLAARELRDQVYSHLIGGSPFAIVLSRHQSLPKNRWNRYWFHLPPIDRRGRSQRRSQDDELAHYFTEKYMGEEFAIEIAQVFHRHAIYELLAVYNIFTLLEDGPLTVHPSCQPQHYIRNLKVTVFMDSLLRESDGQVVRYSETEDESEKEDYDNQLAWLPHLKNLHRVSQLQLMLELQAVYSSTIRRYKAALFPHIRELVKAGCVVTVSHMTPQIYPHVRDMIIYTSTMLPFMSEQESLVADALVSHPQDLLRRVFANNAEE